MKHLIDHTALFESESELVSSLLTDWHPSAFDLDEKDHEAALFAALRRALPDVAMTTQHGLAKGRADIVIEDSHIIEVKLGLTDVLEFDRCIGQMERYYQRWVRKDRGSFYLIVIGESCPDLRDMLHVWFEGANDRFLTRSPFHLIEKFPVVRSAAAPAPISASN